MGIDIMLCRNCEPNEFIFCTPLSDNVGKVVGTITKKIVLFFLLFLLIGLSACGNNSEEPSGFESNNSIPMSVESSPQEEAIEESIHNDINDSIDENIGDESALFEQDVQIFEGAINGTFKALPNAIYDKGYETYIELYEDNSCIFVVNYLQGSCTTKGVYSVNGNQIMVELMSSEPDGFLGEKYDINGGEVHIAYNHIFTIIDNDTLKINDNVYATYKDELFVRE